MGEPRPNNVLMLYPRFVADTFWSFAESCKLMGARRPTAPLGLITVAAMKANHFMLMGVLAPIGISTWALAWASPSF